METDYATIVCGGVQMVKKMLVRELTAERKKHHLTSEDLDRMLGFSAEWPRIAEIESSPELLNRAFLQKMIRCKMDGPAGSEKIVDITGDEITELINQYLENPLALEKAIQEFKARVVFFHVMLKPEGIENYCEKVLTGQPVKETHINSVPPTFYAEQYIFGTIMSQLDEPLLAPN